MNEFKETYLVDFAITTKDFRTVKFETKYEAERVASALSKFFHPGEIEILQVRVRYDKFEEDDE